MSKRQHNAATLERPAQASLSQPQVSAGNGHSNRDCPAHNGVAREAIQLRAYQKWEAAGRPQAKDVQFWLEPEKELLLPKSECDEGNDGRR